MLHNVKNKNGGIQQANKCMHLAAIAYNLKKYLKATTQKAMATTKAKAIPAIDSLLFYFKTAILSHFEPRTTFLKGCLS